MQLNGITSNDIKYYQIALSSFFVTLTTGHANENDADVVNTVSPILGSSIDSSARYNSIRIKQGIYPWLASIWGFVIVIGK